MNYLNPLKPYIIGETAYHHEGDFVYLKRMTDAIASEGFQAIKFHLLFESSMYLQNGHPLAEKIKDWMFTREQWLEIIEYSHKLGLEVVALCDDLASLQWINSLVSQPAAMELHGSALNDYHLLQESRHFKGTIILGIGGSTLDEIQFAVEQLQKHGKKDIVLMYGFQSFPTDYSKINLQKMRKIRSLFGLQVGYADHTAYNDPLNEYISSLGAAGGFNILEKHFTFDFGKERIDYHSAVDADRIKKIHHLMETALSVYGDGNMGMSKEEAKYGNVGPMKKAIVASQKITKGEVFSVENICFKRTQEESFMSQRDYWKVLGLKASKDIEADEIIDFSKAEYSFNPQSFADLTGGIPKDKK